MMRVVFLKQKTAYERRISDGSSDVCSSDLRWSNYPAWYGRRADGGAETIGSAARPDGIALLATRHDKQEQCPIPRVFSMPTTGQLKRGEWSWSTPTRTRPAASRAASRKASASPSRRTEAAVSPASRTATSGLKSGRARV